MTTPTKESMFINQNVTDGKYGIGNIFISDIASWKTSLCKNISINDPKAIESSFKFLSFIFILPINSYYITYDLNYVASFSKSI